MENVSWVPEYEPIQEQLLEALDNIDFKEKVFILQDRESCLSMILKEREELKTSLDGAFSCSLHFPEPKTFRTKKTSFSNSR